MYLVKVQRCIVLCKRLENADVSVAVPFEDKTY